MRIPYERKSNEEIRTNYRSNYRNRIREQIRYARLSSSTWPKVVAAWKDVKRDVRAVLNRSYEKHYVEQLIEDIQKEA